MTAVGWVILVALVAWSLLAIFIGPPIGRFLRGPRDTFDPQDRERVGLLDQHRADSEARVARAMARHDAKKRA